jgi:hypothetical protein
MDEKTIQRIVEGSRRTDTTLARMMEAARMPDLRDFRMPVPPRVTSMSEVMHTALYPLIQGQAENFVRILQEHVRTLESNLQTDESLCVYCNDGTRRIQVKEFRFPTWNIGILSGCDENENPTQLISHINGIQITFQIIASPAKKSPIGFFVPSATEE